MSTAPTARHKVFIVQGIRRIKEVERDIIVCGKMSWAEDPKTGKRNLLDTTAFYTRKAAEVRKLGELRKLEKVFLPHWTPGAKLADAARE